MHFIYVLWALAALLSIRILATIYAALTSPLSRIPGPFWARFTDLWFFHSVWTGHAHYHNIALHKQYAQPGEDHARIVRLGPNLYSIAAPDKAVYGIGSKMPKSPWYEGWKHPSPDRWSLFTDQNIQRHSETRRKFQALYSMSSLVTYEKYVQDCSDIFVQRLREIAKQPETRSVDLAHWLQCYAFDVIGNITYSKRLGFLDEGKDVGGMIRSLDLSMVYSTLAGVYYRLHPYLYKIMERIPGSGAAGRNHLMGFVAEQMSLREVQRAGGKIGTKKQDSIPAIDGEAPRDFLDRIMDMNDQGIRGVTGYNIFMLGLSNIIAGSDTTAVSLSSILYHLIRSPVALQKLRAEIHEVELNQRNGDRIEFQTAQEMPYLQACIKEGLRLHPATGLPLWRVVPEGGATICGTFFPAGSTVGINTWVSHRDKDVWGDDANSFRPERWTEAETAGGDRHKMMKDYFMPFGLGSRTCIGRHISHLEMSKLVPRLLRDFDFELQSPNKNWDTRNYWFVKPTDFEVKVKERGEVS